MIKLSPDLMLAAMAFSYAFSASRILAKYEMVANGIATLVSCVSPLLNSGGLCWVLQQCVGGAQQVAAATQSQRERYQRSSLMFKKGAVKHANAMSSDCRESLFPNPTRSTS
jgi:hypothetical protein